ncbi:TIGR03619 family F420-dependent LLM class oxidoreductase [Rhodococcus tukisamuensis]|uniref:Probable F420-dependent oxidoreductase, Rv2161c family n=1 Tax=Rhodococcus tukisamuensis TaxID=168276 RepID=A0A1G6S826_9NOCA|nr:TIGR03619 family F420-dependent LLM class oxidoreductase [Rhodococcus tukisamuensis]SDD13072.1 probable F420-dependent oxidoreductase, Rv2161c family [Rhodococcus tukisamuensis]
MQVGLNVLEAEKLFGGAIRPVIELAALADRTGVDLISTGDHLGFNATAHAERVSAHGFPFALDQPWYEPVSLLSAVAAVTERTRLGVSVLIATVRPPALLAKQLATLDALSGGRVSIGLGVGWQEAEYNAVGMPFDARFGRMEDTVRACRELWTRAPATFTGREFAFEDFHSLPFPVQERVPVLFGFGPSKRNFGRIARVADGWTVNPTDMASFPQDVALLRECFAEHGRDPLSPRIQVSVTPERTVGGEVDLDATGEQALRWHDAGATVVVFRPAAFQTAAEDLPELLDWMVGLKSNASA